MNPQREIKQLKIVLSIIVMILALYPVFELTRCIIEYNLIRHWSTNFLNSYAELGLIWGGYILIPVAVFFLVEMAYRMGKRAKDESKNQK